MGNLKAELLFTITIHKGKEDLPMDQKLKTTNIGFQCHATSNSENRSIDEVQNLGKKEGKCGDSRQESGNYNFSHVRNAEKFLTQIREAMLVPVQMGTNMAAGNQQKHQSMSFATKA